MCARRWHERCQRQSSKRSGKWNLCSPTPFRPDGDGHDGDDGDDNDDDGNDGDDRDTMMLKIVQVGPLLTNSVPTFNLGLQK